jgi:hypothetical protein
LKKALENENEYRIGLKEQKMQTRFNTLQALYKK